MSNLAVVDTQTGEILDGYTVRSRKQDAAFQKQREKERYKALSPGKRWVASYHDPIREIIRDMSLTEAGALIKLLPYLRFKSEGRLIKDGKPLKQRDIERILGRSKRATMDILSKLDGYGIVTKKKEGRSNTFTISAEFHTMGDVKEGASFTKLYQTKTNEVIEKLSVSEAGLLYKILPFFHYQSYYLCSNPDEDNPAIIDHLNREDLALAIGHEPQTVSKLMRNLQDEGVIMQHKSNKSETYMVHPDVMYRKEAEDGYTDVIRKQFEELRRKREYEKAKRQKVV